MAQLEVEVELQEKITAAALRLAQDKSRSRNISKKRIQSFHKAHDKVTTSSCFVTCHVVNGNLKYVLFILCSITEVMISGERQKEAVQKLQVCRVVYAADVLVVIQYSVLVVRSGYTRSVVV